MSKSLEQQAEFTVERLDDFAVMFRALAEMADVAAAAVEKMTESWQRAKEVLDTK